MSRPTRNYKPIVLSIDGDTDGNARIDLMLDYLSHTADWSGFSSWEEEFIESIQEQWARRGTLTEKQEMMLEKIYDRH